MLFAGLGKSALGETVYLSLEYVPWPVAQDLGHSFFQYRPPGWQITYDTIIQYVIVFKNASRKHSKI